MNSNKWISTEPPFHMNADGVLVTDLINFLCADDKTVHLGYCIKTVKINELDDGTSEEFTLFHWFDQSGYRWENVTGWYPLPEK